MLAFNRESISDKLTHLAQDLEVLLGATQKSFKIPETPARDALILPTRQHPKKLGFSTLEGQARAIHDLASIELQAMELGLRTLAEFPEANVNFRQQLAALTWNEGEHLNLCLKTLEELGFQWGHWPIHTHLWHATHSSDTLLERIFIVHRYLEGSGLDAGSYLCQRLNGLSGAELTYLTVKKINDEEVDHVQLGNNWFRLLSNEIHQDPHENLKNIIEKLKLILPRRVENLNIELRKKAGFDMIEIEMFENLREYFLNRQLNKKIT